MTDYSERRTDGVSRTSQGGEQYTVGDFTIKKMIHAKHPQKTDKKKEKLSFRK